MHLGLCIFMKAIHGYSTDDFLQGLSVCALFIDFGRFCICFDRKVTLLALVVKYMYVDEICSICERTHQLVI